MLHIGDNVLPREVERRLLGYISPKSTHKKAGVAPNADQLRNILAIG